MEEFEDPIIIGQPTIEAPIIPDTEFEDPIFLDRDTIEVSPIVPQGPDNSSFVDLDNIFKEYGRKLTKEDILADDRLMEVVRSNLEARFTPSGGALTTARRGATVLSGGTIGGLSKDYRSQSDEDVFETWQNYQRSFSGGQTITTANELAYGMGADDTIKSKLGAGYLLFDQMDNAFTGEGTWSEMGDAMWDYTKSAVYDPTTILSLGVGKLIGFGANKASSAALRMLMTKAYQEQIKRGATKATAIKSIGEAVKKSLPYATADALMGAGVDVAYQAQLINVDAQEEYSKAQTALTAAGAMVIIPTLVGMGASIKEFRKSELAPQFIAYKEMDKAALELGAEEAKKLLDKRVKKESLIEATDNNFGIITGDSKEFLNWEDIKVQSEQGIEYREEEVINPELLDSFFKRFWFGDEKESKKGYYLALKEAGFVVHPSMLEDNTITGVYGQAIEYLSDEVVEKAIKNFEKSTGQKLGIEYSAAALAENFIQRTSTAGSILWTPSQISRLEKLKINPKDAAAIIGGRRDKPEELPARNQFVMSLYKRLLTSHLATTGANIKGFSQLVSLNTAADFFTAAVNIGQSSYYASKAILGGNLNNVDEAVKFYNRAYGSALGAVRRGFDVVSPTIPIEYADAVLKLNPEAVEKLFRDISGDGGIRDGLKDFNLDKTRKGEQILWKGANNLTKGIQTAALVRLQDDLTKRWAFGSNMNQAIMRAYGVTPEEFFSRKDIGLEMASEKFQNEVIDKAVFRAMRETASVNWSSLPGKEAIMSARSAAKGLEILTNRTPLGFVVPFGSFLNTTIATMADLTGVNAFRFAIKKATGEELDFVTREGAEAVGKWAAGWSAIGLGVYAARERIADNLSYNQDKQPDGSITDFKYDWPSSTIRLLSQIAAHGLGDSNEISEFKLEEVPDDLLSELALQIGGQSVRDLDKFGQSILYASEQLIYEQNTKAFTDMLNGIPTRIFQGITRPLDPINQVVGLTTGKNMNADLRQGIEAFRYIDNLVGASEEVPSRATATRGTQFTPDLGKQILGVRGSNTPNLVEAMMNSAGQPYWKTIDFNGPPEIKNTLDNIAAPIFEAVSIKYLRKNPDYFRLKLEEKEKILDSIRKEVKDTLKVTVEKGLPKTFNLVKVLSNENKKKVREIMDFLRIDGELTDLIEQEDGLQQLLKIKTMLDYYDDIKFNQLDLN